jgi:hypothetical protein
MVMVIFLCSWLFFLAHGCGYPLLFLVALLLAIIMFSCVSNCIFLGCGYGHPFVFLVVFLLAIIVVVFLCSWLRSS